MNNITFQCGFDGLVCENQSDLQFYMVSDILFNRTIFYMDYVYVDRTEKSLQISFNKISELFRNYLEWKITN